MSKAQGENNYTIGYLLKLAQHSLRLQMDSELKAIKLTTPQYAVLMQLKQQPGISNADLARASFITPQTMHGIVSLLEKNKLIKRKPDPDHGRILKAELTKKGLDLVKKAHRLVKSAEKIMMKNLSEKKQSMLQDMLIDCINNLN
jgi:DNA-binding MarR family transcriptional regulator